VVAGGKYTTYRVMARDAVDAAAVGLDQRVPPSCTEAIPLLGAVGYQAHYNARQRTAAKAGLDVTRVEHLLGRYGSEVDGLLALLAAQPQLGQPLPGAEEYLAVEVAYAASHEGALHLGDVLTRRTHISFETWDRGLAAAEPAARLMGAVLDWDDATIRREVEHYRARVAAERESQQQPDDRTADAARLGAPDVRMGARAPVAATHRQSAGAE
jgi:glycerol-3-phosphate dehydrogenase